MTLSHVTVTCCFDYVVVVVVSRSDVCVVEIKEVTGQFAVCLQVYLPFGKISILLLHSFVA